MHGPKSWLSVITVIGLAFSLVIAGGVPAHAGEEEEDEILVETPPVEADGRPGYPTHLHEGSCADPVAQPSYDLGHLQPRATIDEPLDIQVPELRGYPGAIPVAVTTQTLDATFDDLLDPNEPYALAVHQSEEEFGTLIACGDLGGIEDDGRVVFGLRPVEDSGFSGFALLDEDETGFLGLGDTEINVTVYLFSVTEPEAPDVATPEPVDVADLDEEGYAHPEWLVDGAWVEEQLIETEPDPPAALPVIVIGVASFEDDELLPAVPGTTQVDWGQFAPQDSSEASIETWQFNIQEMLLPIAQVPHGRNLEPGDTVLVYDNGTLEATGVWWTLDYLGHEDKHLLNGGAHAWIEETGLGDEDIVPVSPDPAGAMAAEPTPYPEEPNPAVLATLETVRDSLDDEQVILVDTRSPDEYAAGHIPGAVNVPYPENVQGAEEGEPRYWQDAETLRQLYAEAGVDPEARVITYGDQHLGPYVAYFSLRLLGYEDVAAYPGGWAEWSSDPELPRMTDGEGEGDQDG